MHLSNIKIWNFRKIGSNGSDPGVDISFNPSLNVLIGENDSGKTAIIDAVRYVLGTRTFEYQRLDLEDFQVDENGNPASEIRIECTFSDFTHKQAGQFLEWIHTIEGEEDDEIYELRVWLTATKQGNKVITNIRAGIDDDGSFMDGEARDLLRVTYLKPLRDAETELSPGYRSRLAQILLSHPVFELNVDDDGNEEIHYLEELTEDFNEELKAFFEENEIEEGIQGGLEIDQEIKKRTKEFLRTGDTRAPEFEVSPPYLTRILRSIGLELEHEKTGLGSLNKLFMAVELLQLQNEKGLKLALIEELEAHLHPQAQLRVINALRRIEDGTQIILSTHSTTLASNIPIENLILCYDVEEKVESYSMRQDQTALNEDDYGFLYRFLDATRSNLFFARGVIIVEGDAENLLIPTIAELFNRNLPSYGVSIVNVGSKALLRYSKIFQRIDGKSLPIKVAVITDLDISLKKNEDDEIVQKKDDKTTEDESTKLKEKYDSEADDNIRVFHSPLWTMEYDLSKGSLRPYLKDAIYVAHQIQNKIKRKDFSDFDQETLKKWIKESQTELAEWVKEEKSNKEISFSIYRELDKSASKSVTAQWLAKFLNDDRENSAALLKEDEQLKYIRDAIYHVTEQAESEDDGDSG